MRMCSEEFKKLSEKKKKHLSQRHADLLEDYNDLMTKYKLRHPDLKEGKSKVASKPKMTSPLAFYWADRCKEIEKAGKNLKNFIVL